MKLKSLKVIVLYLFCLHVWGQSSFDSYMKEGAKWVEADKQSRALKSFESAEALLGSQEVPIPQKIELYTQLYNLHNKGLTRKKAAHYLELLSEEKIKLKNSQLQSKDSLVVNLSQQYEEQSELSEEQLEKIEDLERDQLISRMRLFEDSLRIQFKNSELREQESLVALEKSKRRELQSIALGVVGVLGLIIVLFILNIRSNRVIAAEKKKSEALLLNILPESIANELKQKGKVAPKRHKEATVMFSDFVGFSKVAEVLDQDDLVALIDQYFREFDEIIKSNGIEKIKTIGDAYMCVCGVPNAHQDHAELMMKASIQIQQRISELREEKMLNGTPYFDLRIGIQTGEVIAGVVGRDKYAYDVWGKSVNLASRVESVCPPGCIAVSRETKAQLSNHYKFSQVLRMDVKNTKNVEAHIYDLT